MIAWLTGLFRRTPAGGPIDDTGLVPLARVEGDRFVVEGDEPYAAARALAISLCWRLGTFTGGTADEVTVDGRRHPITIEHAGGRYRASVPWPLPAASADR